MPPEDRVRIVRMVEAAEVTGCLVYRPAACLRPGLRFGHRPASRRRRGGRARADLDTDQMLLFALVRAIEIIGEAAAKVTPPTRAALPLVPWVVVAMRNRLVHAWSMLGLSEHAPGSMVPIGRWPA